MTDQLANLLTVVKYLDDAVFISASLLFGTIIFLLLKRSK